jgi:ElaB/YqjD/DUF883 family membrane-anchored ribosome-binding protein
MATTNGRDPSLSRLEAEAEHTRAQLVQTVDELRSHVTDTVADIRHQASPSVIKEHAKDYVRDRGQQLLDSVERTARENPLQAAVVALGVAYPIFKIVRSIPAPLLLIGAGFALARPGGSRPAYGAGDQGFLDQARGHVDDATQAMKQGLRSAAETVQNAVGGGETHGGTTHSGASGSYGSAGQYAHASSTAGRPEYGQGAYGSAQGSASAGSQAGSIGSTVASHIDSLKSGMHESFTSTAETARGLASNASATVTGAVSSGYRAGTDALSYGTDQASQVMRRAQDSLSQVIERNPLLVGGIGLVLGAAIAASLPISRQEKQLLGDASDEVKARARDAAAQGFETVRSKAEDIYEETMKRAKEQGLDPESLKDAAANIGDKVKTVVAQASGDGSASRSASAGGEAGTGGTQSTQKRQSSRNSEERQ